jgi:hypothetical protein
MVDKLEYTNGQSQKRYDTLASDRKKFEDIARRCSAVTIPYLLPPEGSQSGDDLNNPSNSLSANGVNSLSNKLMMSLYPPNQAFFRFEVKSSLFYEYQQATNESQRTEDELRLADFERLVVQEIKTSGDRASQGEALEHLVVCGNALVYLPEDAPMKLYRLDRYVVKRDPLGKVIEIITKEDVDVRTASAELKSLYEQDSTSNDDSQADPKLEPLYTHLRYFNSGAKGQWAVHQEFKSQKVKGSEGTYPLDACPFIALRAVQVSGEDYGRPYIERFIGDIEELETLTKWMTAYMGIVMKVVFMVNPGSSVRERHLAKAETGSFVRGEPTAVQTLKVDKHYDIQTVQAQAQIISERIRQNLLMFQARDSERVTAVEVNATLQELQEDLGAFITLLNEEFQLPYVSRKIHLLTKKGLIPKELRDLTSISIVTGIEALGRGHDLQRLLAFIQALGAVNNIPEAVVGRINLNELTKRSALSTGVEPKGLLIAEGEFQQQQQATQQQAMQQQLVQTATPEAVKQIGNAITKGGQNVQAE